MRRYGRLLTDAQWTKVESLLPRLPRHRRGGRPPAPNRRVLEDILWILRSGARWQELPSELPSPSTCWRRLRDWEEQGLWPRVWRTFLAELNERQQLNWSESFMDGSFAPAKEGGAAVGKTKRGKGTMWMVVVEGGGVPLGVRPYSASPAEVRLAEETLATIRVGRRHRGAPTRHQAPPPVATPQSERAAISAFALGASQDSLQQLWMFGPRVSALLARTRELALTGKYEPFKTSSLFDGTAHNPQWLG